MNLTELAFEVGFEYIKATKQPIQEFTLSRYDEIFDRPEDAQVERVKGWDVTPVTYPIIKRLGCYDDVVQVILGYDGKMYLRQARVYRHGTVRNFKVIARS